MKYGHEIRSRFYSLSPHLNYLPDGDRYLLALEQPAHKFNIIGAGMIGQEHLRVTLLEGRSVIHGIYDPNPRSITIAQQAYAQLLPEGTLVVYDSLEAACNDPEVDGLLICTPNYTHLEILKTAVASGKHILLEKPMATTVQDAYHIAQMAKEYEAILQIGLQYRHKAIYVEAIHEALERKSLGEIKTVNLLEHRIPFLDKVQQWNKFSKYSGGTLVEKCCHYFDLLNLFAQSRPASVFATGSQAVNFKEFDYHDEKADILDNAFVTVVYENGVQGSFSLCMFAPMFYEEIVLCGVEGRLKASESEDFLPGPRFKTYLEVMRGEREPSRKMTPSYPPYIEETGHNGSTYYEHKYFVDNIEGAPTTTATADEGFWSIVVGAAAEESVKTGAVVYIDDLLTRCGIVV